MLRNKAVTLLGAGTQGARLAFMWSKLGRRVHLVDPNEKQLDSAYTRIETFRRGSDPSPHKWGEIRLLDSKELEKAASSSWMVVECVPEKLELKRKVVQGLNDVAPQETIIASNSSSYTITEIINGLELRNGSRFLSLHSYWPPETAAIEVMGTADTSPDVIALVMEQCKLHGFQPFHVQRTSTGYIYNRIWAAIKREALLTVAEGVASPAELDAIFKEVLKTPKGPCEQMDIVGLDVVLDIEEHYAAEREGLPQLPREFLKKMIAEGNLGVKSGSGFYSYDGK
ncbi:NAD(P)-binding protein [Rhizodiscina lignyota]|uniref:NAD(P)-binding protein n=1 Tax=Rhizodiscina lignyota TaxID=1504668 RepID=A0A9P4M3J0_9PEZI|nr:NAD(P)-binding protein [Rhizodiscina lignyota]